MRDKKRSTQLPPNRTTRARLDVDDDGCDALLKPIQERKTRRTMKAAFRASAEQLADGRRVAGRIQANLKRVVAETDRDALARSVKAGRTVYQSDPAGSELIERISADGRRTLGQFVKRRFVPVRSSGSGRR